MQARTYPEPSAVLELLKPITWFPPMWAFACGVVSSGEPVLANARIVVTGIVLAGPLVCAMSQAINDWYDREVDAINEPGRPIPSGRIPGQWGLYVAGIWTVLSLLVAATLGRWVFIAAIVGLILAWAYSAPPFRLKRNGWLGNAACGFSYEGLAWVTGAAAMLGGALPSAPILWLALLYSVGAHGIMTLNDFKSIKGDQQMGVDSVPVLLGAESAARAACLIMAAPQVVVIALADRLGPADFRRHCRFVPHRARRDDGDVSQESRREGALVQRIRRSALCLRHDGERFCGALSRALA